MDGIINVGGECREYIYSENYFDFLIKYDSDLQSVREKRNPDCVNIVNNQFLIAYKKIEGININTSTLFSYSNLPKCYGLLDASAPESLGVNLVQNFPGLNLSGKDVLVGFIDTGIDYRHPVFQKQRGLGTGSRILSIWDQTEEAFGFSGGNRTVFDYGAEYKKEDIDRALASENPYDVVPTRDENGHGTFLASVACGSEYEDENTFFSGVAPQADIVVVKLKEAKQNLKDYFLIADGTPCYSEGDIMLGIKYLLSKAIELGKPLVICLGVGSNQGDHNGNSALELYLDTIVNLRGICVTTAGGNELGAGTHFRGNDSVNSLSPEDTVEISVGEGERGFSVEIWGKAPSLLEISVLSPTGQRFSGLAAGRDDQVSMSFLYEGTTLYAENLVVENVSGDPLVFLRFENPGPGIWTILVRERGSNIGRGFDVWLPMSQFLSDNTRFTRPDPFVTLCSPGNGRGSITLEGYNHYDKSLYIKASRGYTRKGRIKPDLVAPAVNVFGAFSSSPNALFIRHSGSSVASALSAGISALLLEWGLINGNNYSLNTEIIRQMMIRGADNVSDVNYPNPSWGWGVLNIYRVFETMRDF